MILIFPKKNSCWNSKQNEVEFLGKKECFLSFPKNAYGNSFIFFGSIWLNSFDSKISKFLHFLLFLLQGKTFALIQWLISFKRGSKRSPALTQPIVSMLRKAIGTIADISHRGCWCLRKFWPSGGMYNFVPEKLKFHLWVKKPTKCFFFSSSFTVKWS